MRTTYPFLPTRLNSDLWRQMDRMFDGFGAPPAQASEEESDYAPAFEVAEGNDHFMLSVDLPGVKKEEIKIEVLDRTLTISGERKKFEKIQAKFKRSFILPNTVSADKIEAHHEDGVLQLYVPKTQAAQAHKIEIQSGKTSLLEKFWGSKKETQDVKDAAQIN